MNCTEDAHPIVVRIALQELCRHKRQSIEAITYDAPEAPQFVHLGLYASRALASRLSLYNVVEGGHDLRIRLERAGRI